MNDTVKLGKPKYEANNKNYFSFKKDQNTFILRILPPMGELADAGKWSVFHRVEFGYKGTDGRMKPFLSPRVVNYDKMVEQESEAYLRREQLKSQLEQAESSGNAQLIEQCKTLLSTYNQDAKHYMNAIDLQGNVGLFKIGHRGFPALKTEIDRLRSEGVDPVGIENGRFFVFSRSGKGRDTIYTVKEYKEKQVMNGMEVEIAKPHPITESIMMKLATDAFELNKVYPSVTPEQEHKIVHGGPQGVDEVFAKPVKKAETAPQATVTTAPVEETVAASPVETTAPLEPVQTGLAQETPVQQPTQEVAASTSDVTNMSEEEFFKKMQEGNL